MPKVRKKDGDNEWECGVKDEFGEGFGCGYESRLDLQTADQERVETVDRERRGLEKKAGVGLRM